MSTEENKALVRRWFEEVVNKGNLDVLDEICAPTYVEAGDVVGPEGPKQYFTEIRTASPDFHITVEDMIAEGDKVAVRWTFRGTHKGEYMGIAPTGKQVTVTGITIWCIADGKFVESWENKDDLGLMQQLGVIPPMGEGGE